MITYRLWERTKLPREINMRHGGRYVMDGAARDVEAARAAAATRPEMASAAGLAGEDQQQ